MEIVTIKLLYIQLIRVMSIGTEYRPSERYCFNVFSKVSIIFRVGILKAQFLYDATFQRITLVDAS